MNRIRVLIVDSQPLMRRAWCSLLAAHTDLEVVGEAGNLTQACEQALAKSPDIITVDIDLRGEKGLELLERLEQLRHNGDPIAKVMVLTRYEDVNHVRAALAARVSGYVATSATEDDLIAAIRSVHAGRFALHAASAPAFVQGDRTRAPGSALDQLTQREREVLHGVSEGHTNKAIAARLGLSIKTIETYRSRLCAKLNLHSRAELLQFSLRHGLLSIPAVTWQETTVSTDHTEA